MLCSCWIDSECILLSQVGWQGVWGKLGYNWSGENMARNVDSYLKKIRAVWKEGIILKSEGVCVCCVEGWIIFSRNQPSLRSAWISLPERSYSLPDKSFVENWESCENKQLSFVVIDFQINSSVLGSKTVFLKFYCLRMHNNWDLWPLTGEIGSRGSN